MDTFELIIGNKAYSSWSMRPWLALKHAGAVFSERRIPLYVEGYKQKLLEYGPSGKVPVLRHGTVTVWESLAICEYLAELFPERQLWPADAAVRAHARCISAEMHSGFNALRAAMPFNCRASGRHVSLSPEAQRDVERVQTLWRGCRNAYGKGGPWLLGRFSIADAMYVPVALRFVTYSVSLTPVAREYVDSVRSDPAVREWIAAAMTEAEVMESNEVGK